MRGCFAGVAVCLLLLIAHAIAADEPKAIDSKPSDPKAGSSKFSDQVPPEPQLKIREPQPADQQPNPQTQAETLLERARQLSDIRGVNGPSFRLRANFSFIGEELETFEGTYTEYRVSDSRWRREIVVGQRKKIEIANGRKLWEIESDPVLPEKALRVEFAAGLFPERGNPLEFESVESVPDRANTRCAVTKPTGSSKAKAAFCFDQSTGAMVERIVPQWARYHITDFACAYGDFKHFGNWWFPFEMVCRQGGHRQMEVHVAELAGWNFIDAKLFDPPRTGAVELGLCAAGEVAAKPDYTPAPLQPVGMRDPVSPVTLRMVVDANGKPENIRVVRPVNKSLDAMAVGTVGRWRFKPATCNGEPMAQRIEFEVAFRSY